MVAGKAALSPLGGVGEKLGGYKGFGWATAVELLCTAFQSGPFGEDICGIDRSTGEKKAMPLGHVFVAIDIEPLTDVETFRTNAGSLLRAIRASKKDPNGPGRIWTAGEPEHDARTDRTARTAEWRSCPLVLILRCTSRGRRKQSNAAKMSRNGARTAEVGSTPQAHGGFWVPPALQQNMVDLRASKLSDADRARFTPFPFEE